MWTDITFYLYLSLNVVAAYGFILFCWWWSRRGRASPFYAYLTLLLGGSLLRSCGDLVRLYYYWNDYDSWLKISNEVWWDCRLLLVLLSIVLIDTHMTWRVLRGKTEKEER